MAQAFVQGFQGAHGQSGLNPTCAVTGVTAGHHLRLNVRFTSNARSVVSITDNAAGGPNTWQSVGESPSDGGTNNGQAMWYAENCLGGAYTVTLTMDSAAASQVEVTIDEFSGTATTSSLDQHTSGGQAAAASPLATLTTAATTSANESVYTCACTPTTSGTLRPLTTPAGYSTDTSGQERTNVNQFVTADKNVTSTGAQSASWAWTGGNAAATAILATFKDAAGGGPVSKTDTDTGIVAEQTPAIKLATPPDTATLTEQVPQISPTAQTDSFAFSETQTVTPSSAVSKTDTDSATLTETTNPPVIGVTDSATLNDTAITLVVTDVQQVPDFTLTEQTPRIGLSLTDSLTFSETEKLTASFIRFVDSDTFGFADTQAPQAALAQTDSAGMAEALHFLTAFPVDADAIAVTDAQTVAAFLKDIDTESLAESQAVTIIGGFTGYVKGVLVVQDRLAGTLTGTARLAGTLGATDRLEGTLTVQPVGPP